MGSLAERVGHHAIDSDRSEQQRDTREDGEDRQCEAAIRERFGDHFVQRANRENGDSRVDGLNLATNCVAQCARISASAKVNRGRDARILKQRRNKREAWLARRSRQT